MDTSSVVLTGDTPEGVAEAIRASIPGAITLPDFDDDDTWVARTALAITTSVTQGHVRPPLLLVVSGALARHAPALGFAQRAARRAVRGYVLIDPQLPRPGQVSDWPDAPVIVVLTDADDPRARDARLRGWEVLIGDAAHLVAEVAARP